MRRENSPVNVYGGVGLFGLLGITFIVLKLTGHISWSWFWILSPLWIGPAVLICLLLVGLWIAFTGWLIERRHRQSKEDDDSA